MLSRSPKTCFNLHQRIFISEPVCWRAEGLFLQPLLYHRKQVISVAFLVGLVCMQDGHD